MCGFTGYLHLEGAFETANTTIRQMLALQQHRGPDDSGVVAIHRAGAGFEEVSAHSDVTLQQPADLMFGFNRLSILDLSPMGHQPMISPDGQVVLMMNGEVYNAFDYKPELEALGHRFKSTTDTEVVLHLYLEYGMNGMIQRLNGMFALAIYDFRLGTLFLARDRFGIKPLYVLREAGRIAFASEMKSFKALPNFRFEADYSGIDAFLLFRNGINQTLFKNIENCPPGVYLSIQGSDVKSHTYYRLDNEGQSPLRTDAKEVLDQALRRSVRSQMISDVKLGCQLSGGVDSSLVTYYAAEALKEGQLETISIIFDDPIFSEARYIQQVADQLHLQAHQYVMDGRYYFDTLQQATWHFEQPLNHPNTIGIYLLSQEAKKHVTVLLSGEGADESLA